MKMWRHMGFASWLVWGGACASAPVHPAHEPATWGPAQQRAASWMRDQGALLAELEASAAEASPDCPRACELRTAICELAERICSLRDERSASALAASCTEGRQGCHRATERTHARCSCPPPSEK